MLLQECLIKLNYNFLWFFNILFTKSFNKRYNLTFLFYNEVLLIKTCHVRLFKELINACLRPTMKGQDLGSFPLLTLFSPSRPSDKLTARRAQERKEQYKQVRAHVKKDDGRLQVNSFNFVPYLWYEMERPL